MDPKVIILNKILKFGHHHCNLIGKHNYKSTFYLFVLSLSCFLLHCGQSNKNSSRHTEFFQAAITINNQNYQTELSIEQQAALDALNELQTSTDEENKLYSTFAGIVQACYPADTMLTITQTDFRLAMEHFIATYCKHISIQKRDELARASSLALETYTVLHCKDSVFTETNKDEPPFTGTWIIPNLLGRRDVIIVW